ncbi:MAG: outer membrane protein [Xanthobacteraceae bacterium]
MKIRAVTALAALLLTPTVSSAADWPIAAPQAYRPIPFIPRQAVEWTGLYFGVNAGYGWAQGSTDTSFNGEFQGGTTTLFGLGATELSGTSLGASGKPSGAIAGGQVGFNWQAGMAVFGAEFDAQWSGQQASFAVACASGCTATEAVRIKSLLTGRARFGLAFDWIVPYVTAGAALASLSDDLTVSVGGVTGTFQSHSGSALGWTAGAGVDVALWSNWSTRLEYLYVSIEDFSTSARIPNVLGLGSTAKGIDFRDNIVRVGLNYRFGPRGGPGVLEAPVAAPFAYRSADFLPNVPMFADKAGSAKRPPAATMLAGEVPQREAPIVARHSAVPAPAAAASEAKVATPPVKNFADIEDTDDTTALAVVPGAITLPSLKQRQKADDDSSRLKRIMAICSGC